MKVDRLDHLVLTVDDVPRIRRFYAEVLGMEPVTFGDGRHALRFGAQKINLHETGRGHPPVATNPLPGSADLCFITSVDMADVIDHVRECGIHLIEGPVRKEGALGPIRSIYFLDPEGNLIEVSNYEDAHGDEDGHGNAPRSTDAPRVLRRDE